MIYTHIQLETKEQSALSTMRNGCTATKYQLKYTWIMSW